MRWIFLIVVVVLTLRIDGGEGCSNKYVGGRIKECTEPVGANTLEKPVYIMLLSGLQKIKQLCQSGKLQSVFSCLNDLYNHCASTREGAHQMDLILDANKWRDSLEKICDNIHYLIDHEQCEKLARQEFDTCIREEGELYDNRVSSVRTEMAASKTLSDGQKLEAMSELACEYTVKIQECLRKPYERYCPRPLTNLAVDIFQTFMPPACAKRAMIHALNNVPRNEYDDEKHESSEEDDDDTVYRNEVVVNEKPSGRDQMDNVGYEVDKEGWPRGHVRDQAPPIDRGRTKGGPAQASEVHDRNAQQRLSYDLPFVLAVLIGCRLVMSL